MRPTSIRPAARALLVAGLAACGQVDFDPRRADVDGGSNVGLDGRVDAGGAVAPGLVLWYPMDRAPAGGVDNAAGDGLAATCAPACPTLTTGPRGGAYQFDGLDDTLAVAPTPALDLVRGTMAAWIRIDQQQLDAAFALLQRPFDQAGLHTFEIYVEDRAGLLEVHAGGDAGAPSYVVAPWPAVGTWVHVALTWDDDVRFYFDGVLRGVEPALTPTFGALGFLVAAAPQGDLLGYFAPASFDDVRLYDRVLPATEVAALAAP